MSTPATVNRHGCYLAVWTYGTNQEHDGMPDIFIGVENFIAHCTGKLRAHLPQSDATLIKKWAGDGLFDRIRDHIENERQNYADAIDGLRTFGESAKPGEFEAMWGLYVLAISFGEGFDEVQDYDEMLEEFRKREDFATPPKDEDRAIAASVLRHAMDVLLSISNPDRAACERVARWLDNREGEG